MNTCYLCKVPWSQECSRENKSPLLVPSNETRSWFVNNSSAGKRHTFLSGFPASLESWDKESYWHVLDIMRWLLVPSVVKCPQRILSAVLSSQLQAGGRMRRMGLLMRAGCRLCGPEAAPHTILPAQYLSQLWGWGQSQSRTLLPRWDPPPCHIPWTCGTWLPRDPQPYAAAEGGIQCRNSQDLTKVKGQIPYDCTLEVTNTFKGLDLIDRVPEELWTEVRDIV